jgi:hypothetical protein
MTRISLLINGERCAASARHLRWVTLQTSERHYPF